MYHTWSLKKPAKDTQHDKYFPWLTVAVRNTSRTRKLKITDHHYIDIKCLLLNKNIKNQIKSKSCVRTFDWFCKSTESLTSVRKVCLIYGHGLRFDLKSFYISCNAEPCSSSSSFTWDIFGQFHHKTWRLMSLM